MRNPSTATDWDEDMPPEKRNQHPRRAGKWPSDVAVLMDAR